MKVLFVSYHHLNSNSGLHIYNLAKHLSDEGVDVSIFVPNGKSTIREITNHNIKVFNYADFSKDEFSPDIIHTWTPRECVRNFVDKLVSLYGCPYIVHLEDNEEHLLKVTLGISDDQYLDIQNGDEDIFVPDHLSHPHHYKEFLSHSSGVTALIDKLLEFKPENIPGLVIWPSYDKEFECLQQPNVTLMKRLRINTSDNVIVYMGNVHSANQEEVFSLYLAIGILNRKGLPIKFIRTGEDYVPLIPSDLVKLNENCIHLGFRPRNELPALLGIADVLVQPGRADSFNDYRFPSKLPDYLVSGKPVVLPASNIGHFLKDGEECLLLKKGGAIEIAENIELLLNDKRKRERIGKAGREFAIKHFNWKNRSCELNKFYHEYLGR